MGCVNSKTTKPKESLRDKRKMQIAGSHHEHHLKIKDPEKASTVRVTAGVTQLKQVYDIDRHVLGKGAFGKVYKGTDKANREF